MKEKQNRDSLFVGLPGLLSLLFVTVVSVYFHAGMITGFLCMVSLVCILSRAGQGRYCAVRRFPWNRFRNVVMQENG